MRCPLVKSLSGLHAECFQYRSAFVQSLAEEQLSHLRLPLSNLRPLAVGHPHSLYVVYQWVRIQLQDRAVLVVWISAPRVNKKYSYARYLVRWNHDCWRERERPMEPHRSIVTTFSLINNEVDSIVLCVCLGGEYQIHNSPASAPAFNSENKLALISLCSLPHLQLAWLW